MQHVLVIDDDPVLLAMVGDYLMSSKDEPELRELAEDAGVDDYLRKPFSAEQLIDKIRKLLP